MVRQLVSHFCKIQKYSTILCILISWNLLCHACQFASVQSPWFLTLNYKYLEKIIKHFTSRDTFPLKQEIRNKEAVKEAGKKWLTLSDPRNFKLFGAKKKATVEDIHYTVVSTLHNIANWNIFYLSQKYLLKIFFWPIDFERLKTLLS